MNAKHIMNSGLTRQQVDQLSLAVLLTLQETACEMTATEIIEALHIKTGIVRSPLMVEILQELIVSKHVERISKEMRAAAYVITSNGKMAAEEVKRSTGVTILDLIERIENDVEDKKIERRPQSMTDGKEVSQVKNGDVPTPEPDISDRTPIPLSIKALIEQAHAAPPPMPEAMEYGEVIDILHRNGYSARGIINWLKERGVKLSGYKVGKIHRAYRKRLDAAIPMQPSRPPRSR